MRVTLLTCAVFSLTLPGCSAISLSAMPLIEVAKAAGQAMVSSSKEQLGEASLVQRQVDRLPGQVCIEFNPQTPTDDLVPALRVSLDRFQVTSRVFEAGTPTEVCPIWLRYSARVDWGVHPRSRQYEPFLTNAELTVQSSQGRVLATGQYRLDPHHFWNSQWASTQDKLDALVTALVAPR